MNKFLTKIIGASLAIAMMIGVGAGMNAMKAAKEVDATEGNVTYQHVFDVKPATGSNKTLSGVSWTIAATNLNGYNSANYAGVQFGTSKANGSITLTSTNAWGEQANTSYTGKTVITEVRLWLNLGGTSVTPSVSIGGTSAVSDGTAVVKNGSAGSDWTKTSKVTFTPASNHNTGIVVVDVTSVKAGYICALEIDCQEPASDTPTVTASPDSLFFRTGGASQTVTATASNFSGTVSYSWAHQSGTDCVDLVNASSATVTMTPKNTITQFSSGVYRVTATSGNQSDTADVTVRVDNGGSTKPYTIAEARAAIDSGFGKENAYVKGIIYQIDSYSQNYQSITYWISDDGTDAVPFQVYSGLNLNGTGFSAVTDLKLGDIVVVTGELKKQNSTTYEFNYNNQLVSRTSIESISVKTAPSNVEYCEDDYFDPTGLVVTATYDDATTRDFAYAEVGEIFTFNPSPSVALTNQNSVSITIFEKTTTQPITVIARVVTSVTVTGDMANKTYIKGSDWNYSGLSLTVTYNIGEPVVTNLTNLIVGTDFTVSSEKADGATSLTIAGSYNGNVITSRTITDIAYVTSVTFVAGTDVGSSNTSLSKYGVDIVVSNGDLTRNDNYRPYAGSDVTITCNSAKMVKISFTFTNSGYNTLTGTGYSKNEANGTWAGYSNVVVLSASTQARITQIVITVSEINQNDVDTLKTSTTLAYHYSGNTQDGFEYSNISIRFGGVISKTLWNNLDTNDHNISGFGVMIASGDAIIENELIKDNLSEAKLADANPAPSIDNADIVDYYMSKAEMATPVESGDNYIWNLFQRIDETDIEKVFVAVAYIKVGGDYVFMEQVRYSAKTLAADYIANRGCNAETAGGSLAVLAAPTQA